MLKTCPDSVDVTDLQFKLQCKLKVFNNNNVSYFSNNNSLLTCASRYGLIFVGTNTKQFQVIQTINLQNYFPKDKEVTDYPRRNVDLPSAPQHLSVNCDNTIIAVVIEKDQCPVVLFYDVLSFLSQSIKILKEIRLSSTPNVLVKEINWNPSIPAIFTSCKSDGTLGVYELKGDSVDINELPAISGATCFCWSPKGKQIAVGSKDGKITQYKPDLKAVKVISEPKLDHPHSIINLQWVSNYQFIGIYQSDKPEGSSSLIVVDAPKAGEPSYMNYEDICYSGSSRPSQFYLILQQNWNFLMVASANSTEVGVLGTNGDSWTQWIMSDTARAELPLSSDHQETLPVGLTFDVSSTTPLPWGESTIPPCPRLGILSHQGVLCIFNVVYLKEGIPTVCTPPDPVQDTSGLSNFVTKSELENNQFQAPEPKTTDITFASKENVTKPALFSNLQQSTPLVTGKTESLAKSLFVGQATITPIKAQPSNQGSLLFGGQTAVTPIGKSSSTNTPVSQASNDKYASIFSALTPTSPPASNTVPIKPIVITAAAATPKPEAAIKKQEQHPAKTKMASAPNESQDPTAKQNLQISDPKLKAERNALISQMIKDEFMYLEAELKVFLHQGRSLKISLGTDEEKTDMVTQIESLQEFVKEALEISFGQSCEIHCLKQNLIQSWAWFEEANSHYNSSKNETINLLLKLQPLDSVSKKRLEDVEQLIYYIDSQLQQASKALDEQWGNFQDYAKKTYRVQMPTMEAIFQTMVRQSAILQKHTYVLKDISMRLKKKTNGFNSSLLFLDKPGGLKDDLRDICLNVQDIVQLQHEKIRNRQKSLSKANKLRGLLKHREVTHVTAVKPQISSWTINQSLTSKTRESISLLGSRISPASKPSVVKNLNFIQSTPSKDTNASKLAQAGLGETFSKQASEKNSISSAGLPSGGFLSLSKTQTISSSQGSAFAPIGSPLNENQQLPKSSKATESFSFGNSAANVNKTQIVTAETQRERVFSEKSVPGPHTTASMSSIGTTLSFGSNTKSLFKPAFDTASVKPESSTSTATTSTFSFSFGATSTTTSKNVLGTNSSNFSAPKSQAFSYSNTTSTLINTPTSQEVKPSGTTFNVNSNADMKSPQTSASPAPIIFGSTQSSFSALTKTSAAVTTTLSTSSTSTKSSSGVSSIFANLQSVIDKATGTSGTTTSTKESSKPISFGFSSGAVTTTTQAMFGSLSSATSTSKSVFETSSTGGLFGSNNKSKDSTTSGTATTSLFGSTSVTPSLKTDSAVSTATAIFGSSSLLGSSKILEKSKDSTNATSDVPTESKKESVALSTTTEASIVLGLTTTTAKPSELYSPPSLSVTASDTTSSKTTLFEPQKNTTSPLFGSTIQSSSVFGSTTSTSASTPVGEPIFSSSTSDIFGSNNSLFGSKPATTSSSGSNIFGTPATTTGNIFGASDSSKSVFGVPASTSVSAFPTAATTSSVFAQSSNSQQGNVFSSSGSIFGTPVSSATNIFGSSSTSGTVGFGSPSSSVETNVFASALPATSGTSNMFGNASSSTINTFGVQSSPTFGTPKTTATVFGQQSSFGVQPTTASSTFGQPSSFGFGTTTPTTGNVFGSPPSTTSGNVFGSPPSTTSGNIFGSPPSTTSGNIFGSSTSTNSGFGSAFGGTATTNTFGSPSTTSASSFGFGSLSVGTTSTSSSIFGSGSSSGFGTSQAVNPFGKSESKSPFGSSSSSIFGNSSSGTSNTNIFANPSTTNSSVFGSNSTSTFGSTNTAAGFGSPSTFGSTTFGQKPAFGQSSSFGSTAFGSPQTGAFSGTGVSTAQSGFGTSPTFPKPTGFGSPPVFGSSPASTFGASSSFGMAPSFGGTPTFGSPEKVFGSSQVATGSFGATAAQAPTGFGNLATQNTVGFGSLAQQANTPSSSPFSTGNTSFSSWR